jgi:predicted metalloprotease with PDZ domain
MLKYIITPNTHSHIYLVKLQFTPNNATIKVKLPTWIPGSYMIREFSKNIINISAIQNKTPVKVQQTDKNTWKLSKLIINKHVIISYEVYAYDAGIRTAYIDSNRGYFNNTSLCLSVVDYENQEHQITLGKIPDKWEIATGLKKSGNKYIAKNYAELIDCPFELGKFTRISFNIKDILHHIILSGVIPANFSKKSLIDDVSKICSTQIRLFGGAGFKEYTFILNLSGDVYTGLEHENSTLLLAPYYSLPLKQHKQRTGHYIKLLGLISHEYFHAWNVKRIKPQAFNPYNLDTENYTSLLWWFEGITSYYDDLMLYRAGVINQNEYLQMVIDNINKVYKYNGVKQQTLVNSSLTSWTKYYRPDENSPNVIVSYYTKGALVGLCLDLLIRNKTQNELSLDTVMRGLYTKWQADKHGILEDELPNLIAKYTGCNLHKQIKEFTQSTIDLPLKRLLTKYGINLVQADGGYLGAGHVLTQKEKLPMFDELNFGAKLIKEAEGCRVINVYTGSLASKSGIATNDLILALDKIRVSDIDRQIALYRVGDKVTVTLFRQDQLLNIDLKLENTKCSICYFRVMDNVLLANWL